MVISDLVRQRGLHDGKNGKVEMDNIARVIIDVQNCLVYDYEFVNRVIFYPWLNAFVNIYEKYRNKQIYLRTIFP